MIWSPQYFVNKADITVPQENKYFVLQRQVNYLWIISASFDLLYGNGKWQPSVHNFTTHPKLQYWCCGMMYTCWKQYNRTYSQVMACYSVSKLSPLLYQVYIKNPKQNTHLDGPGIQNEHIHQNVKWLHSVNLTVHAVTGRSKQCWCKDSACLATLPHNQAGDSGSNHSIHQNGSQISEEMPL